jgi:hypothetical protein
MQAAQTQVIGRCSPAACMVSIAISVCMFFPYSKNAGAEFVSKIDLSYTHPAIAHCA